MENYYLLLHVESEIVQISHISRALLANSKSEFETNPASNADEGNPHWDTKKGKLLKAENFVFIICTNFSQCRRFLFEE